MIFLGTKKTALQTSVGLWQIGDPYLIWTGFTGANHLELAFPVPPNPAYVGATLLAQALAGMQVTQLASVRFRK